MRQTRTRRTANSLERTTDTLCALLAQQVQAMDASQREAKRAGEAVPNIARELKEATAVLKDLAGVARTLCERGIETDGVQCGVVVLPQPQQDTDYEQNTSASDLAPAAQAGGIYAPC